jgi:BirA family biotin operon repressor/biotin-[acetyl-CoA-carboxylase] ligase
MDWASRWIEEGFEPVRQGWKWRAKGIGEEINVQLQDETLTGVFKDLGPDGSLILDQDGTERMITAGDVFFPNLKKDT